jgi:hypothetical protein
MDVYLVSRIHSSATEAFVEAVEAKGSSFLGPQYDVVVRDVVHANEIDTVITTARNRHNPLPGMYYRDKRLIYLFSGYLVDDIASDSVVSRYFGRSQQDDRPILESPGGIYSYTTVRLADGQVSAGHSMPTLEPVYYCQVDSGLHVGNHPLLVHVAAKTFGPPQIDERFYLSAIGAGVAIDDSTPFVACYRLPPRRIIVNQSRNFGVMVRSAPRPKIGRFSYSTYSQRRGSMKRALIQSGSILQRLPVGELRVSGGKDSRLVAAYLHYAGVEVVPVNQNFPQETEGQVADRVARVLGFDSCVRAPIEEILNRDNLERDTRRKIAFAGGLPAVASLQYATRSEGSRAGVPLIMGHAHLQRGGLKARIRSANQAFDAASSRVVSMYLLPPYAEPNRRTVRSFVNEVLGRDGVVAQGVSFHAYLHLVLSYQFQSLYAYVRNWNPLITPLVEERFALLCESIADAREVPRPNEYAGITDLRNERIAMGVTEDLAPELLEFPLSGDRYRCDSEDWVNFELRDPGSMSPASITSAEVAKVFNTRRIGPAIRARLWEQIEGTGVARLGAITCRPEIWRYVSEPKSSTPEDENATLLNQFVWTLYGMSIILGTDWWRELASG